MLINKKQNYVAGETPFSRIICLVSGTLNQWYDFIDMENKLEHIAFSESYLLGWKVLEDALWFYLDLYLTEGHEEFVMFDTNSEAGCYKLAIFKFYNFKNLKGLEQKEVLPIWNQELKEYKDIDEINFWSLSNHEVIIDTDFREISFDFAKYEVELLSAPFFA